MGLGIKFVIYLTFHLALRQ